MSFTMVGVSVTNTILGFDVIRRLRVAFLTQSKAACRALTDLQTIKIISKEHVRANKVVLLKDKL